MLDKLCERKAGYLGFWVGNFKNVEDFYKYIQSFYCVFEEDEDIISWSKDFNEIKKLLKKTNLRVDFAENF